MRANFLDLNLLPEQRPQKERAGPFPRLGWLLIAFAVVTLIPLWQLKSMGDRRIHDTQQSLKLVRQQVRHVDDLLAEKESLERALKETTAQADQLERDATILQAHQSQISMQTSAVLAALPPRSRLEDITQDGPLIKIRGRAGSASLALSYARTLQELGLFRHVSVTTLDRRSGDPVPTAVTFVIELEK